MRYKIEHHRQGFRPSPVYRDSIDGAIKVAQSKGWWSPGSPEYDMRPTAAYIMARNGLQWEVVLTVTAEGIKPTHWQDRPSVRRAEAQLAELQKQLSEAKLLHLRFSPG